jgi:hypothetical protein
VNIDARYKTQQIEFETFKPADRDAEVAAKVQPRAGPRWRPSEPPPIVRKVLADSRRGQRDQDPPRV